MLRVGLAEQSVHTRCAPMALAQASYLTLLDEQTVLSHTAHVPPSLPKQCALTGTPDDVIDQAAEWRDNGVDYASCAMSACCTPACAAALPPAFCSRKSFADFASYEEGLR